MGKIKDFMDNLAEKNKVFAIVDPNAKKHKLTHIPDMSNTGICLW
jgi:hypothetical protein